MLTAEYGGTGGKTLEGGMVVEEPDIEIGAGVSSKGTVVLTIKFEDTILTNVTAISRRMATDKSGQHGPQSSRDNQLHERYHQPQQRDDRSYDQQGNGNNNNSIGVGPSVPGFGFNFPAMPNGFQFPPGFTFPTAPGQPPPPGAS